MKDKKSGNGSIERNWWSIRTTSCIEVYVNYITIISIYREVMNGARATKFELNKKENIPWMKHNIENILKV
jgi:hypothetical protein